jgi:hypothetical protein
MVRVYLSRRNLLTLLAKLDKKKAGESSLCTIVKNDTTHKTYPQSHPEIIITALEDEEYYTDREPGKMAEDL